MNGQKTGRAVARLLAGVLAVVLGSAGVGRMPLVAHSQEGVPVAPEAGPYSYAFTYQGQLKDPNGQPVNSTCDFRFSLWDDPDVGTLWGGPQDVQRVTLVDGLFTARLDFGWLSAIGVAFWLEIEFRCPAGSGDYVLLEPRQELTAAPAALALALPFQAWSESEGPLFSVFNFGSGGAGMFFSDSGSALYAHSQNGDGVYVQQAGTPPTITPSGLKNGVEVAGAEGDGLHVGSAGLRGLYVDSAELGAVVRSATLDGLYVDQSGRHGVYVNSAQGDGVYVDTAKDNGVYVLLAYDNGLSVNQAYNDGVFVNRAGSPTATSSSDRNNGIEVAGAEGDGLYLGSVDANGVYVYSAGWEGLFINSAGASGVRVEEAAYEGFLVTQSGSDGFATISPDRHGLYVHNSAADGVMVFNAGNPDSEDVTLSDANNGFEVAGAEGYGLFVGSAGRDGVHVNSAGSWAGYFDGNIYVTGNCQGCRLAVFGLNAGDSTLAPGDVVAIQGVEASTLDNAPQLWNVVPAAGSGAVVGVVSGRAEVDMARESEELREGETGQRLVPRDGSAQPGEYLTIVISGPMQVRSAALEGAIQPGARLTVGTDGLARGLKTVTVDGVTLSESAPVLGIALDVPDAQGLVWVLVNPQ